MIESVCKETPDSVLNQAEGWDLFITDGRHEIQRIDAPEDGSLPKFPSDQDALDYVKMKAFQLGPISARHNTALNWHMCSVRVQLGLPQNGRGLT